MPAHTIKVIDRLPQFLSEVERKAATAVTAAVVIGQTEAATLTPIDTGTLINSQVRELRKEGSRIVATAGYTASYALPVHDPDNPQKFRRAGAEKEFLKKGFERQRGAIDDAVKRIMKP
jgi:predicted AAA+ superfamily ATPase